MPLSGISSALSEEEGEVFEVSARKLPLSPQQKWLSAFGNTADGVFITDTSQRIVCWNKAAERILGYSQAEVLKQHCYEVLPGKCCDKPWCYAGCKVYHWVRRGILPDDFDLLVRTKGGKDIWVNVSTIVVSGRRLPLTVHLFREVTCQKRNEMMITNILSILGGVRFPKGNPESEKCTVRPLICRGNGLSALTRREVEVLQILADGLSTPAVAQQLGVSPFTVRNHIQNALQKLGLHNKAQGISFVLRNALS